MFRVIAFTLFTMILTACSTTDDPRQGGLISGVANLENGGYERRVESLRQRANRARSENIRLSQKNQQLNQQLKKDSQNLARIKSDISRTSQQMVVLRRNILSKKTNQYKNKAELVKIKTTIDKINSRIDQLNAEKARIKIKPRQARKTVVVVRHTRAKKISSISPNTIRQLEIRKKALHEHYLSLLELLNSQL